VKKAVHPVLEQNRIREGEYGTDPGGLTGAYQIYLPYEKAYLRIIANTAETKDAKGWEHVSVSLEKRCPLWTEMCLVKELFWDSNETVIQFHPAKSEYVNCHPNCLHLWRDTRRGHRLPPSIFVGPKDE
jgi:hypothetical protein